MKGFIKWVYDITDDVMAYVLTVLGIIFSEILPHMKELDTFTYTFSFWKISSTMVIALLITLWQESLKPDESGSKIKSKEARKKQFIQRMFNALLFGFGSAQIIDTILKLL